MDWQCNVSTYMAAIHLALFPDLIDV